ncbi:hypothetical protein ACFQVD_10060 [Streptosporangium amethystogenes subsp. fukuiense]|uniref:Transposase n=1 Tax=Streptosporangium amethystogenes subsp. fukuiense TaxID=698418 RepID=A0ABW2SWB7_9ACTN
MSPLRGKPLQALAHISPASSETVNFLRAISVEIDTDDASGYRPLRHHAPP